MDDEMSWISRLHTDNRLFKRVRQEAARGDSLYR